MSLSVDGCFSVLVNDLLQGLGGELRDIEIEYIIKNYIYKYLSLQLFKFRNFVLHQIN